MPKICRKLFISTLWAGSFLLSALLASGPVQAASGINQQINFQGRLLNAQGAVVADGYYNMEFKVYQDGDGQSVGDTTGSPAGSLKWTEDWLNTGSTQGVEVKNGYLSVQLGSRTAFGASVNWNSDTLWLSMQVGNTSNCTITTNFHDNCGGDGEMTPMKRLSSTPYAINSGLLNGLSSANFIQLAQGVQTDNTTTSSIYLNKTGTSGNIVELQKGGVDAFLIGNTGDVTFGTNANHAISVATAGAGVAGKTLTVAGGAAGSGAGTLAGGSLSLNGGAGGGTNGAGGAVSIDGGAANGTGANGGVNIGTNNAGAVAIGKANSSETISITGGNGSSAVSIQTQSSGTIGIGSNNIGNTIQVGSTSLSSGTQAVNVGNNNTAGGTTNVTIGAGGTATGGTTAIQSKGNTTLATNGVLRATFDNLNNLYLGNGTSSSAPNNFAITGTSSSTSGTTGGSLTVKGGDSTSGNTNGGNLILTAGAGSGTGTSGSIIVKPNGSDSTTAFQVQKSDGVTAMLTVDTKNSLIGLGAAPSTGGALVQVSSTLSAGTSISAPSVIASTGVYTGASGGTERIDASGNLTNIGNITGSAGVAFQGGAGTTGTTGGSGGDVSITAGAGGNGSTTNGNGGNLNLSAGAAGGGAGTAGIQGSVIVKNSANSTAAFQVQNSTNSKAVLTVDTTNNQLAIGTPGSGGITGGIKFYYAGSTGSVSLATTDPGSSNFTLNIDPTGGGTICTTGNGLCTGGSGGASSGLAKNAVDTSAADALSAYLYAFTNTGNAEGGGVLSLNNGNNTGSIEYLKGTSSNALRVQDASSYDSLVLDTASTYTHLKVYDGTATAAYADISYDDSISSAIFVASAGTTQVGGGSVPTLLTAGSGQAVNITGHAASSWTLDSGDLTLDVTGTNPNLNIGTGTTAKTITIGYNGSTTSTTNIKSGTGGIVLAPNGGSSTGVVIKPVSASSKAFQVQNSSSSKAVMYVDNSGNTVYIGDGSSSGITGQLAFDYAAAAGKILLKAAGSPGSSTFTLQLPDENGTLCTTAGSAACLATYGGGTTSGFLAKDAVDTSSADSGGGALYTFTNAGSGGSGNVLKLNNGNNTGSSLIATTTGNPGTGNAVIYAENKNATPTGNLLDLEAGSTPASVFNVDASGNIVAAGSLTNNGTINSDTLSGTALTFGGASAALIQSATSQALNITGHTDSTWSLDAGNLAIQTTAGGSSLNLDAGTAGSGSITIGTNANNIAVGTGGGTIALGAVGSSTVSSTINIGTTNDATGTQTIAVGSNANATSSVSIDAGNTGAIAIGNSTTAHTVNIANGGGGGQTLNLGSTSSTSTTTINGGVNGSTPTINLQTATSGVIAIGAINNSDTVNIGSTALSTGTQTINIGSTNTAGGTTNVVIGTGTSASGGTTTVQANGALTLQGNGATVLKAINGASYTAVGFASPTAAVTYNFQTAAAGTYNICTTATICASYAPSTGGNYIAKNAVDSSSAAAGTGTVYSFTNSSSTSTGGVLSLNNGNNTGSTFSATTSGNPGSSKAVIYGQNTNATPSGNLLDLEAGSTPSSKFSVNASGDITNASTKFNTTTLSASAITFGASGTASIQPAVSQALTITGHAASTWSLDAGNLALQTSAGASSLSLDAGTSGSGGSINIGSNASTISLQTAASGTVNIATANLAATIQIGSTTLSSGTQTIGIGNNNTAGGTTNVTIGAGSSATGGSTAIQSKGNTTIATNGVARATFDTAGSLYLGNGTSSTAPANFTIRGTDSTTSGTAGSTVTLQGGSGTVGNSNGGNISISGGAGVGSGAAGLVLLSTPTFSTTTNDPNCYTGGSLVTNSCTIAAASVDGSSAILVGFNQEGQTATLPAPTIATAGRIVYVTAANSSKDFTLEVNGGGTGNDIAMRQNTSATMIWNGSGWTAAGASSSTTLQAAYDNTLQSAGGAELVVSHTTSTNGLTIRDSSINPVNGTLLSVQTSSAATLISVNGNVTEYASDAGAESAGGTTSTFPASTWSSVGSASVSRYTTYGSFIDTGEASVSVGTTTAANDGVSNTLSSALTANMHYNVSLAVRLASGTFTDLNVYYSVDGTAASVPCTSGQAVNTSVWTKVNCTFAAPATGITAANAILIRQTGAGTARSFYVDNLSVTIGADYNYATDGGVDDGTNFGTNWTAVSGAGVTRSTSAGNDASDSAQVITTGTGQGVRNLLSINPLANTLYRVTVYAASTTSGFNSFTVRYSPNGGTNFVSCADYNTQSISDSTTSFTEVTCYISTDSTTVTSPYVYFTQSDATGRTFYVDTFSATLSTDTTPNVQIGGGVNGGPVTLLTLDRAASAPIASNNDAFLGSLYYDTSLGELQCYEADGWGSCGASPNTVVTISPEFTNAVMHGTGIGTMNSDICSGTLHLNDGTAGQPTICSSSETYNFYKWTSPQASAQTYSIYVTYQLPDTFKTFASGQTSIMGRTDSNNATVDYSVYREDSTSGLTQCGPVVPVSSGSVASWQIGIASGAADPSTCGFSPSNSILFKIDVVASQDADAYVGNLGFTFSHK